MIDFDFVFREVVCVQVAPLHGHIYIGRRFDVGSDRRLSLQPSLYFLLIVRV